MDLFLPGLCQGAEYGAAHLGPLVNTGLPPALDAEVSCSRGLGLPLSPGPRAGDITGGAGDWHCWPPAPSPSSPTSPRTEFTPWCQTGAAAAHQSPGPAVCAAFTRGEARLGRVGPGVLRLDCSPSPLGNGSEGGPSAWLSCGGCWGRGPASPLPCEGRGLVSVCPLPAHKFLPRSFGGGRGPSCGQLQPSGPRMDGGHLTWVQLWQMQRARR